MFPSLLLALFALPALANHDPLWARQASASSSSAPPPATPAPTTTPPSAPASSTSLPPGSSAPASSGSVNSTTSYSFSLLATNPTAVPLSVIVSGASSMPTQPLPTTYTPGSIPTGVPGAPPLPNAALLNPANYPALDKVPPTDSALVQQWIQEVAHSSMSIPNISATNPGGCPANPQAVADSSRCWWTCGGCTRSDDITTCPDKGTWGLTYDDGPAYHTPDLLTFLDSKQLKSTFFVVGSRAISFPQMLQTEYMGNHQIAVHTWSHPYLTTLTNEQIIAELGWSRKIIKDVLGVTPNMMRPPYGDIDDRVRAISLAMGLQPVIWTRLTPLATFDTGDFNIAGGTTVVQQVLQNWEQIIGNASTMSTGFIVLEHDLFQQSVEVATGYILPDAIAHNFQIIPVASCLHLALSDAYVETNNNQTHPPKATFVPVTTGPGGVTSTSKSSSPGQTSDIIGINMPGLAATFIGVLAGAAGVLLL